MGNSSYSFPCGCSCSDQSTQVPATYFEDLNLWELYWCRLRLEQEEYFKQHGIGCGLKCPVFEGSGRKEPCLCNASIIKPRNTASDEDLDRNAIHLCCKQREAAQCEDEYCSGNPYPSHKKEYLEAIKNKSSVNSKLFPAKNTNNKVTPATNTERRQYWMKYFPPLSLVRLQNGAPEQMLQEALENPCPCCQVKQELPTCEQISDLIQCPNISTQEYPMCNPYSLSKYPDTQCPRSSFDPTLSPATRYCSEQMTTEVPKMQIKSMHIHQPLNYQARNALPDTRMQYRGHWTEGGPHYGMVMGPQQQITHTVWSPAHIQTQPYSKNYFLENLHVGQISPTNVSVIIYSNNILTAEVKGYSHQAHVKSTISKRWMIPPGVPAENITCFLGNENLVIVTLPPPDHFYQLVNVPTAQCLGPPRRISYPYPHM